MGTSAPEAGGPAGVSAARSPAVAAPESIVVNQVAETGLPASAAAESVAGGGAAESTAAADMAVRAPVAPAVRREEAGVAAGGRYFTIQAAAFRTMAKAEQARAELAAAGYEIEIVRVELASKGSWHRVFLGRFASEEEAREAFEALRSRGILTQGRVLRDDRRGGEF